MSNNSRSKTPPRPRGVLALLTGRLPRFEYDPFVLQETTRWMRRRKGRRPTSTSNDEPKFVLEEYDPSRSEFTLLFVADSKNLHAIRFRGALVDFVQSHAKEECQCICVPNSEVLEYLCDGTGFMCLPWHHEHRSGILRLLAADQVPSVIVVQNATGRRITNKGMQAIEGNKPRDVIERWRRGESGLTLLQTVSNTCGIL